MDYVACEMFMFCVYVVNTPTCARNNEVQNILLNLVEIQPWIISFMCDFKSLPFNFRSIIMTVCMQSLRIWKMKKYLTHGLKWMCARSNKLC